MYKRVSVWLCSTNLCFWTPKLELYIILIYHKIFLLFWLFSFLKIYYLLLLWVSQNQTRGQIFPHDFGFCPLIYGQGNDIKNMTFWNISPCNVANHLYRLVVVLTSSFLTLVFPIVKWEWFQCMLEKATGWWENWKSILSHILPAYGSTMLVSHYRRSKSESDMHGYICQKLGFQQGGIYVLQ